MSAILSDIVLGPGKVTFDGFPIQLDRPLHEQLSVLDEDLIQIEFPNKVIVDLGWFPSRSPNGEFQVRLVKNYDWDSPILFKRSKDIGVLKNDLVQAIESARRLCATISAP